MEGLTQGRRFQRAEMGTHSSEEKDGNHVGGFGPRRESPF